MVASTAAGLAMPHPALLCTMPGAVLTIPASDAVVPLELPDPDGCPVVAVPLLAVPLLAVPLPAVVVPLEVPAPLLVVPLAIPPVVPEDDELPLALALPLEPASDVSIGLPGAVVVAQAPSSKKAVTLGTPATLIVGLDPGLSFELRVILISNSVC